jgi:TrmH family RNA methyltransferase
MTSSFADTEEGAALAAAAGGRAGVRVVADREIEELSRTETPQGVLAAARIPAPALEDLFAGAAGVSVALDGVQDPGNAGAIVRTAEALGAEAVIALTGTADLWSPKVVRAAAGALFRLPVARAGTDDFTRWAGDARAAVYAADAAGDDIRAIAQRAAGRSVLVLGNEGAGVSAAIREAASRLVAVPQRPGTESLNVAAAGAILLWELIGRGSG